MNLKNIFSVGFALSFSLGAASLAGAAGWNYDLHGADWTGACSSGASQSPVDIITASVAPGGYTIDMSYKGKTTDAVNNGHTVQYNADGRTINIVDNVSGVKEVFTLVQFHLHNGSEHTVNGQHFDLEAHFVHANNAYLSGEAGGRLAVIGVFLQAGDDDSSEAWNKVLNGLPQYNHATHQGETLNKRIASNYYKLLPSATAVWTYEGSLTTPGCNEIVNWIVSQEPVTVSHAAVESFSASQHHAATYRNTQPLNGRAVTSADAVGTRK